MKRMTLEQQLLASRPASAGNQVFVDRTMQAVRKAQATETFDRVLRTTNATKKEKLYIKVRTLPRLVALSMAVTGVALAAGTAYAAYRVWLEPSAIVRSASHNQALIQLRNCIEYGGNTDMNIVLNTQSGLSAREDAKYVLAMCETQAVQSWAMSVFQGKQKDPSDILLPYRVQRVHGDTITLADDSGHSFSIQATDATVYVADGNLTSVSSMKSGDTIAYVVGLHRSTIVQAIIRLSLPAKYYGNNPNAFFTRIPCTGDVDAWCVAAPSLDVLGTDEAGASPAATGDWYDMQGALVRHSANGFTIKNTAGTLVTIPTSTDIIAAFNTGSSYGSATISVGDVLDVSYRQSTSADHQVIEAGQVESVQLLMSTISKQENPTNSQKYHY